MSKIELLDYDAPAVTINVLCGKGTYIRAIARDLGCMLGCGAYLSSLRRTRVGPFLESHALPIDSELRSAEMP